MVLIGFKRKTILHGLGGGVVLLWLVMIGLLVQREGDGAGQGPEYELETEVAVQSAERNWKEIFLKGRKVGYAVDSIRPFEEDFFIQEEVFLKMNLMGLGNAVSMITQSRVDKHLLLKNFHFTMSSGAVRFRMSGKVQGDRLIIETGKGRKRQSRSLPLESTPIMGAAMMHYFKFREIRTGDVFRFPLFDPSTMAQNDIAVQVAAREPISINNITYHAFRLETEMWGKKISLWVDEKGRPLKEEGFMGLTIVKSSAARAPEDLDREMGVDLYDVTSIVPDRKLPNANRLRFLKLKLAGIDRFVEGLNAIEGGRQSFQGNILEIQRESVVPTKGHSSLRVDSEGEFRAFLKPEFNIESDDSEISALARRIAGNPEEPGEGAKRLLYWVYRNIEKRPVLSLPSAREVLRSKVGDCNEHATLLTALLRAAGIPARICIGLVYSRERFYYHAWTEAYIGEWISMDATLNQMPADVGHIRLIKGNLEKQVEIAGIVGEIGIEILDYAYD